MRFSPLHILAPSEILLLMRNISVTLKAGVPLARALELFEKDLPHYRRGVVSHLRQSVETGHSFSSALKSSPWPFPSIALNLIQTGELSGTLQQSITDVVQHLWKVQDLKRKIRSAMMYPTFVLVALLGMGLSIGTLVLPEMIPLFESLDITLPWTTRVLLVAAKFFDTYGILFSLSILLFSGTLLFAAHLHTVKPLIHHLLLSIPYLRIVVRNTVLAQMCTTLATLLRSSIPITEAIAATAASTNNRVFQQALQETLPTVKAGHTFGQSLRRCGVSMPEMMLTLIDIGEETGTLTETLNYLAEYYEGEVDFAVKNMTTALEPLLLIGVGLLVGFTVLSIITPIYDVTGGIQ